MLEIRLYLDDNLDNNDLISVLQSNGFDVISPRKIGMSRKQDEEHLKCAILNDATLLTSDYGFRGLHRKFIIHKGIIVIYRQNNPRKDMTTNEVIRALKNIEKLGLELKNSLYKLNDFNY